MSAQAVSILLAMTALAAAACILPRSLDGRHWRVFAAWTLVAPVLFLVDDPAPVFAVAFVVVVMLTPHSPADKVAYFIAIVPFLPGKLSYAVPFPGINFLITLTPLRLCTLLVLLPLLFRNRKSSDLARLPAIAIVVFVFYSSMLSAPDAKITTGIRTLVEQALLYAVPFLVISTAIRTEEDLRECFDAFIVVSAIMAMIALLSAAKQWNFYAYHDFADFRTGIIRVTATANTHSLGYHLAAALLLLEAARRYLSFSFLRIMALRLSFLAGVYLTGSRGALAGLLSGVLVLMVMKPQSARVRRSLLAGFVLCATLVAVWLATGDFSRVDPHGTFAYRQELLATSLAYLQEHLLFGDVDFLKSGRFNHLIQGQGIVDITNYYLQIALLYGLVGFTLVFGVFAMMLASLTSVLLRQWEVGVDDARFAARASLLATLVGWLVLVTTTSDVGLTIYLGMLCAALSRAALALTSASERRIAAPIPLRALFVAQFAASAIGLVWFIVLLMVTVID